jgi:hypothetical protein
MTGKTEYPGRSRGVRSCLLWRRRAPVLGTVFLLHVTLQKKKPGLLNWPRAQVRDVERQTSLPKLTFSLAGPFAHTELVQRSGYEVKLHSTFVG